MQYRNNSNRQKITPEEFNKMSSEEKIMKFAEGFIPPAGVPENEALNSLFKKMEHTHPGKERKFNVYIRAVAAVFLFIIGFYTVSSIFGRESVKTQLAEHTEFILPDGSNVVLNADSKITWSDRHFNELRKLTLKGEAYFDVKKGNNFIINTKNGSVEVLGTQLDVFSRDNEFRVNCISGKVKVWANNQQQIILPGEEVELTPAGLVKYVKKDVKKSISWMDGVLYFEDKPLVSIFDELERQFDVSVNFTGNKNRQITVSFSSENLTEALDVICIPMDLSYDISGNKKIKIYDKK